MEFVCISDTHNHHRNLNIPYADMIIHTGDCTGRGEKWAIEEFCEWYGKLPHQFKVLIAGNHDFGFENNNDECREICRKNGIIYLQDEGTEIEGIKIWGSPQTPEFFDWAFNCWRTKADVKRNDLYGYDYKFIGDFWKLIPEDTDILLTHGPPHGILDKCPDSVGCEELLKKIKEIKPKYHIFGHIHEGRGVEEIDNTTFINASSLDGRYKSTYPDPEVFKIGEE